MWASDREGMGTLTARPQGGAWREAPVRRLSTALACAAGAHETGAHFEGRKEGSGQVGSRHTARAAQAKEKNRRK